MYQNAGGDQDQLMPMLYSLDDPNTLTSTHDFSAPHPDAIVVGLGTNDFYSGDPGQVFETSYQAFVDQIRLKHPDAHLFLAASPMLSEPDHSKHAAYLNDIISKAHAMGDTRVHFVAFEPQDIDVDGAGCDYHPNVVTQQKMSVILEATLRAEMGW